MLSGDTMYTWDHWSKLRASVCSAPLLSSRGMFFNDLSIFGLGGTNRRPGASKICENVCFE